MREEFHFAWEGAEHPEGPWRQLRVIEFEGWEAISRLFWFDLQLVVDPRGKEIGVRDLVGSRAALKILTHTSPSARIVHGVVAHAEELEIVESDGAARFKVRLSPAFMRAALMRNSFVHVDKTLRSIIEGTLERTSLGAGLVRGSGERLTASDDLQGYATPRLGYAWRLSDTRRIDDPTALPYCVQYDESDIAFVSRLLENEGISYHFEHSDDESLLVLTDYDGGRIQAEPSLPCGPHLAGREVFEWRDGGKLRPRSVFMNDYDWRKPQLPLAATSPSGVTEFTDTVHPGGYQDSDSHGRILAEKREQRFDSERATAAAKSRCRILTAGSLFQLDHPAHKFSGTYLVTSVEHRGWQPHMHAARGEAPKEGFRQNLECVPCGRGDAVAESNYRPERLTPKPRIHGTQTAIVTAEPSDPGAEINVGGPSDLGCVRVKFLWDLVHMQGNTETPSSCWIRVSQFFAGANHGALWHPRVGNEVIVEFLDGDPDRPIITGRVYNGVNLAPENATQRPTYSAIQSLTSPYNGNYNLIAFEDLQGEEEIIIHCARDFDIDVRRDQNTIVDRDYTRKVGRHDNTRVQGNQKTDVEGSQETLVKDYVALAAHGNIRMNSGANITGGAAGNIEFTAGGNFSGVAEGVAKLVAPLSTVIGKGMAVVTAPLVIVTGGTVQVMAGDVHVVGGTVNISGGTVNVKGGSINLNC
jgi:type VI secretion system secreted protein VgrG